MTKAVHPPVAIDIDGYKRSPEDRTWELPPWEHPMSYDVIPLFYSFDRVLYPLGTVFTVGRNIRLMITASHNIDQAIKREPRLSRYLFTGGEPPREADINRVGLWLLHHAKQDERVTFTVQPRVYVPNSDIVSGTGGRTLGRISWVQRFRCGRKNKSAPSSGRSILVYQPPIRFHSETNVPSLKTRYDLY